MTYHPLTYQPELVLGLNAPPTSLPTPKTQCPC